jgi:transposase-like protein
VRAFKEEDQQTLDSWQQGEKTNLHTGHTVIRAGYYKQGHKKIQRLHCLDCRHRFSADTIVYRSKIFPRMSRYSDEEISRIINGYFDGKMSFRSLPRHIGIRISAATVYRLVKAAASNSKSPLEVSMELKPTWGSFLQLDATQIRINGLSLWLLIAIDTETLDIVDGRLLPDEKDPRRIGAFLREVRDSIGYQPRMIVIDDNPSLKRAVREIYPFVPLQLCVLHKQWTIDRLLPDSKISDSQRELKARIQQFLFADTLDAALGVYRIIFDNAGRWPDPQGQAAIRSIKLDLRYLTNHFNVDKRLQSSKRLSPRTNSVVEGIFSRLKMKINQVRGFKSAENLPATINLLLMHYRATALEGAKDKRSPLERAQTPVNDWIQFSQRKLEKSKKETALPDILRP